MASPNNHSVTLTPRQAGLVESEVDLALDPDLFKALADPTRCRLFACLLKCSRPCSVSEIAECCSVDFSVVARHLSHLARAGLVESEKKGRTVWYSCPRDHLSERFGAIVRAIEAPLPDDACCGTDCCPPTEGETP